MSPNREKIILTYKYLLEVHEELLTRTINVVMTGEHENINSVFKAGDTFQFDKEMFRDSKDENVNKLIAFHDELENLMNSLANINNIMEEELDEMDDDYQTLSD